MRMKYILVQFNHEHAGEVLAPILFPDVINHVDMLENMERSPYRAKLISAGFVEIYEVVKNDKTDLQVICFGESESLSSRCRRGENKSRGEPDAEIIKLVQQGWTCSQPEYIEKMRLHKEKYG
jgi:hypothetical protein